MFNLIKDKKFISVLKFSMIYRFIMQLLITPLILYVGKLLLNYHKVQFMSTDTIIRLLSKPSVWIFIIVSLGAIMFLLMIELSSVIVLSEYDDVKASLIPFSLNKIAWTLKPKNLIYLPILMIVLLGFHFGMTTMITDTLFVPEFIMDTIIKTPIYMIIYTIVSVVAFVVAFHLVFLFHNLFIAETSFKEAVFDSIKMVRGNRINFIISSIKLGIRVSITFIVFYALALFTCGLIIYITPPFATFNAVSLSTLFIVNRILLFIILNSVTAINVMFLTNKYHEYKGATLRFHSVITHQNMRSFSYQKTIIFILMIVTLLIQGYGAYQITLTFDNPEFLEHKIYITSHRGNSSVAPENTIAAIRAAKKDRADSAEIDVQLTSDGSVVVIHDFKLSRLANDPRTVIDLTLAQIKELEVGSWFSQEFAGEKIPTLNEVIEESGHSIKLNIELKPTDDETNLAIAVIDILKEYDYFDHVVISSLNKRALSEVKKLNSSLKVGYIIPLAIGQFDFEDDIDFYSLEMSFVNKSLVEKLKNQNKEIHVWTVNSESDLKKMQRLQVDNIITDNPVLAKKVLSTNLLEKGILEILSFLDL